MGGMTGVGKVVGDWSCFLCKLFYGLTLVDRRSGIKCQRRNEINWD